jgi:molybdate transport system ATP-binding protein
MAEILIDLNIKKQIHTSAGAENLEVSLQIPKYGFVTLFGKSGVGKTTLLRIIAGLTKADSGFVKVADNSWFDSSKKINIRPQKRNIGFVFQDYALFPNMTVKEHLLFAQPKSEHKYVSQLLETFHLKGLCERKPAQLSGGQQQRLAVARALARKPEILLLDEPLSALDSETRSLLQHEIISAHRNFNATTLLVSHDVNEVFKLSDYVYIIENGVIHKQGTPREIFEGIKINSKIVLNGKIIKIDNTLLTVSINNTIIMLSVSESEAQILKPGDSIEITALATNPMIRKI